MPVFPNVFVGFACHLASVAFDFCGGVRSKPFRSREGDSLKTGVPCKRPLSDGKDRARTSAVSASDLEDIRVPCRKVTDADGCR